MLLCSMLEINDDVLYCIALHCIALHCIALYCIVLYCIVLICLDLRSTGSLSSVDKRLTILQNHADWRPPWILKMCQIQEFCSRANKH